MDFFIVFAFKQQLSSSLHDRSHLPHTYKRHKKGLSTRLHVFLTSFVCLRLCNIEEYESERKRRPQQSKFRCLQLELLRSLTLYFYMFSKTFFFIRRSNFGYASKLSETAHIIYQTFTSCRSTSSHSNDYMGRSWANISFCTIYSSKRSIFFLSAVNDFETFQESCGV